MPALPRRSALRLILATPSILPLPFVRKAAADDPRLSQLWRCGGGDCPGYEYDPMEGDPEHGAPSRTAFQDLPPDWYCPKCGASKAEFRKIRG